jgi:hypothetical protein
MKVIRNNEISDASITDVETSEITLEAGEHLWIETPRGRICVFVGESYSSITSWVHDTHYAGFFTNNATKKTSPCNEVVQHVQISPKGF